MASLAVHITCSSQEAVRHCYERLDLFQAMQSLVGFIVLLRVRCQAHCYLASLHDAITGSDTEEAHLIGVSVDHQ